MSNACRKSSGQRKTASPRIPADFTHREVKYLTQYLEHEHFQQQGEAVDAKTVEMTSKRSSLQVFETILNLSGQVLRAHEADDECDTPE